eukprot:Nk52_evm7s368 gene=Nk52_evmTU7s368
MTTEQPPSDFELRGRMLSFDNLTDAQSNALTEFVKRVEDLPFLQAPRDVEEYLVEKLVDDEEYMLRWLVARDFNVDQAEKMIRNHAEFRKEFDADNLLNGEYLPREALTKYFPAGWHGISKQGCPIFIERIGNFDAKGLIYSCTLQEMLKLKAYHGERHLSLIRKNKKLYPDKNVNKIIIIIDMDGFGYKHLWRPGIKLAKTISHQFQDNYPEIAKHFLIINPPTIYSLAFSIVKPILQRRVQEKIVLISGKPKDGLLKYIDEENLPVFLGGLSEGAEPVDPESISKEDLPKFLDRVTHGGDIPESYYLKNNFEAHCENFSTMTVSARDALVMGALVDDPSSLFNWEFTTCKNDIGFGVYYIPLEDTKKIIKKEGSTEMKSFGHACELLNEDKKFKKHVLKFLKKIDFNDMSSGRVEDASETKSNSGCSDDFKPNVCELQKPDRVQSHIIPEQGAVRCEHPGLYIAVFDNRYSIFRSKEVHCFARILSENQNSEDVGGGASVLSPDEVIYFTQKE